MIDNQYYEMMGYPCHSPIAGYPSERLESMYPDIYHRVYPRVMHMCMVMDVPSNPQMYPCIRRDAIERMTDDIYMQVMSEMGGEWDAMSQQQLPGFGPGLDPWYGTGAGSGGFLRDLVSIILIRELLFRRRRRFF